MAVQLNNTKYTNSVKVTEVKAKVIEGNTAPTIFDIFAKEFFQNGAG